MTPAPGVTVTSQATPPSRAAATDIGRAFMLGITQRGPLVPQRVRSMGEFVALFGPRDTASYLYDSVETTLRIGGGEVVVGRVVGPDPAAAAVNLYDQDGSTDPGDVALVLSAAEVGEWGNGLNATVTVDDDEFVIAVDHDDDGPVATSPALADRAAALEWADTVPEIVLALGTSDEDPRAMASTALTGGDDDRANITTDHWQEACDRLLPDFGAGQVTAPGITTDAVHDVLRAHCAAQGHRVAFLDLPDTHDKATLLPLLAALRANSDARYGTVFGPWATVPGLLPGSTRVAPYSAVQAGLEAQNAAAGRHAGEPAAGDYGTHPWVLGLTQNPWSETERETLNDAGYNVAIVENGAVYTYGYRTLVDPNGPDQAWTSLSHARLNMQIVVGATEIAKRHLFKAIDGKGHRLGQFAGDLHGLLLDLYNAPVPALFGDTPADAFTVDVGPSVNTPDTLEARQLNADLAVAMSPFGERVNIAIYKSAINEPLAA